MQKKLALLLSLLLTGVIANTLFLFGSSNPVKKNDLEEIVVSKVLDGDTLDTADGRRLRLANINAPEKSHPESKLSIDYLKHYEGKTLSAKILGTDNRGERFVAQLFTHGDIPQYINLEMVKNGFAPKAWVERKEGKTYANAEREAVKEEKGIWKSSPYKTCLIAKVEPKNELLTIHVSCTNLTLAGFEVQDESREIFKFPESTTNYFSTLYINTFNGTNKGPNFFWNKKSPVWNNDKDTVYIRDSKGLLVFYDNYGY